MSTNTLPTSPTLSPEISSLRYSSEIVEIEENTSSSPGITAEQNEEHPHRKITTQIATASSSKNLASSANFNESKKKKKTLKKAVNFVIATGRMPKPKTEDDGTDTTSAWASSNPLKRLASLFIKDKGESSQMETEPSDDIEPVEVGAPELYTSPMFESSEAFRHLVARMVEFYPELKFCLCCFSVFPENAVIKRRVMTYWWMGESFIQTFKPEEEAELVASSFFNIFIKKGFIVPIREKWNREADSFRMHPFVRLVIITLAKRAGFFDFDLKGNPTASLSNSFRACLVGEGFTDHQASNLGRLWTLFNCSETYLDFNPNFLFRMKSARVLYLGLWQASAEHFIEVDDDEFLSGLKNMKFLRLFSLHGVSGISKLPEDAFDKLDNLVILDLRACQSLEFIPENIGSLKSLTHLDISGCYLLEHMPKSLGSLSTLQVFKGFIVGDNKSACTLDDLGKLEKLRKLSIFTRKEFPMEEHLTAFKQFIALRKLTIEWEEDYTIKRQNYRNELYPPRKRKPKLSHLTRSLGVSIPGLPVNLTKLDLLCLPDTTTPEWLNPYELPYLKKLYIRGAVILDLGQFNKFDEEHKWTVEVLRLKHMPNLDMDWRQFQRIFPKVISLEMIECPKLTFFPCDARGVWVNKSKLSSRSSVQ